jgi:hypothetical protein
VCVDKHFQKLSQEINAFDVADVFLPALLLGVHLLLDVAERIPWPIAIRKVTSATLAPFQQFLSLQDFKDNLGPSLKPASWKTRGLAVLASVEFASQLASLVYIFTTSREDLVLPALTGTAVWVSLLCHIEFISSEFHVSFSCILLLHFTSVHPGRRPSSCCPYGFFTPSPYLHTHATMSLVVDTLCHG